jgi:6-pyruvoyltetrahydropterin/6-carboxytetrahydropterin synthase
MDVFRVFTFEATHELAANVPAGHEYARLHGHSVMAEIHVTGPVDKDTGLAVDPAAFDRVVARLHRELDHRLLNEVPGLSVPTLENIARWIWRQCETELPSLSQVVVRRPTCGEGCVYRGAENEDR